MITTGDVLTTCGSHNERLDWVSPAVERNASETAAKVTLLLMKFGASRKLTSGFRDLDSNRRSGGAPYSKHLYGQAADIEDKDGRLAQWITKELLTDFGLWMEDPAHTTGWVHVQVVPPLLGARVFVP